MKKALFWMALILTVILGAYVLAAEGPQGMMGRGMSMMDGNSMMKKGQGMMGMMKEEACPIHPMASGSMVATSDGGVIVMMGPKLLKYDKDLNLVKEVEIKIDWAAWHKTMMEHRKMMMQQQPATR
jgi:hypothetical protein